MTISIVLFCGLVLIVLYALYAGLNVKAGFKVLGAHVFFEASKGHIGENALPEPERPAALHPKRM
jgi:hypothetical protein